MDAIRPRRNKGVPDFTKQTGREERVDLDDDEHFVGELTEEPIPNDPSQPKPIAFDFGKGASRFDHENDDMARELGLEDDMLDLDPQLPERKVKGVLPFAKAEDRFKK